MSGGNEFTEAAIWRRWRDGQAGAGRTADEPDALTLAAYAAGRLGRGTGDPETDPALAAIEAWLAEHPDSLDDIGAARAAPDDGIFGDASAATIARAQSLIVQPQANIVPLRRTRSGWRGAAAWSGIAASLIAASLVGFSIGIDDGLVTGGSSQGQGQLLEQALIGPSAPILSADDEDSGT
ncbi:MAG TPA: hypothetical protein VIJ42_02790 [Stellaceae bacterium]